MADSNIRQELSELLVRGTVRVIEPLVGELAENTSDPPTKEAMALILKAIEILNPDDPFVLELERTMFKTEQEAEAIAEAKAKAQSNLLIDCDCELCNQ